MELLQLRYFRTVARMEHMTKAAAELLVAQPALSKTISRLEADLGVPLFDRHGKQIRLNEFGRAFLKKVDMALALLEEGKQEVAELAGMEQGSIHLATWTLERLSEPIGKFVAQYPEVRFRITQAADEIEQMVEAGAADIGFTPMPLEGRAGINGMTVLRESLYLGVANGHRFASRKSIRLEEAAGESFIGYKEGFPFQRMNERFLREAGIAPNFICRADEPSSIVSLVKTGLGVAMVGSCGPQSADYRRIPIEHPVCRRDFQVVWNENKYLSKAAVRFRDFLADYFKEEEAREAKNPPVQVQSPAGSHQRPSVIRRDRAAT